MTERPNIFGLLTKRRFAPLFVTQYFGAFNDNFLKCAILAMVTFLLARDSGRAGMLTNLAMALFMLPYFLFSAAAGNWVDARDKSRCCRIVKIAEIVLMVLTAFALYFRIVWLLMFLLFCMGAQSTFFGPAKYSLLPQHLKEDELLAGNALIEGGTFLAILTGSIGGSLIIVLPGGTLWAGGILVALAVVGCFASFQIPPAPPASPVGRLPRNLWRETCRTVGESLRHPVVGPCILALSVFWMAGALYVSLLPVLCLSVIGGNEVVNTLLLTLFSIGVGAGSLAAGWILKGAVSGRLAPWAMGGMALFSADLAWCSRSTAEFAELAGPGTLFCDLNFLRIAADLLLTAFFGGMFSVPLQAVMQYSAPAGKTARVIAANNIVNAVYMSGATLIAAAAHVLWDPPPGATAAVLAVVLLLNAWYCRAKIRQ